MAEETLKQFMQRFLEGISTAFPSAAAQRAEAEGDRGFGLNRKSIDAVSGMFDSFNNLIPSAALAKKRAARPNLEPSVAKKFPTNPVADKLFEDSYNGTSQVSKVTPSPIEDEDFSSVIKRALAEDGVITLRGDKATVGKKPKVKGGFSKMPSNSTGSSSVPDIIKISQSMSSGDGIDPQESSKIVKELTKHIKDPKIRQEQELALAWAVGDESGRAIADKKEKELSRLQAQSIKRNLDQADITESALTGSPEDRLRAIVRFRKGGKETKPIVDQSRIPNFFEPQRQGVAKFLEEVLRAAGDREDLLLSMFSPKPGGISKEGQVIQERLKTMSGAPVDTVEEFTRLLQALIEAENENR